MDLVTELRENATSELEKLAEKLRKDRLEKMRQHRELPFKFAVIGHPTVSDFQVDSYANKGALKKHPKQAKTFYDPSRYIVIAFSRTLNNAEKAASKWQRFYPGTMVVPTEKTFKRWDEFDPKKEMKESLVGSAPGLGVGFQSFAGPEPGRLHHDKIKVLSRYNTVANPAETLDRLIKNLRSRTPAHETPRHGEGRIRKHRRSSDS